MAWIKASMLKQGAITTWLLQNLSVTVGKLAANALAASAAGRSKMQDGFFDAATVLAKFGAASFDGPAVASVIGDDCIGVEKLADTALELSAVVTIPGGNGAGAVGQLFGTPVQVIPAPPAGYFIELISVHFFLDWATVGYDSAAAADTLRLRVGAVDLITPIAGNTIGVAVADYHVIVPGIAAVAVAAATAAMVDVATSSWYAAAGNSPLKVECAYRIRTLAI